jgi:glycosyltransferase involved in cell wall biosynthesis
MQQASWREGGTLSGRSTGTGSPDAPPCPQPLKLHFWQDSFSPHQLDLLRAAARHPAFAVSQSVVTPVKPERASLGWSEPGALPWPVSVNPDRQTIEGLLADDTLIHVHQGLQALDFTLDPLPALSRSGRPFFCALERPRPDGPSAPLRLVKHAIQLRRLGRQARLLCIGRGTERWFRLAGAPASRLFPYAYFMDACPASAERVSAGPIRVLFAGQLIRRKRLDLLIDALSALPDRAWSLDVIGSGPERERLVRNAARRGVGERISFVGTKDRDDVLAWIDRSDVLVLPSDHDGWGAVVQEALNRGVPVVCSDNCGASILINDAPDGRVFRAGDRRGLGAALAEVFADVRDRSHGRRGPADRMKGLTGEAGAEYLLSVINSVMSGAPRPIAPWLNTSKAAP